MVYRDCGRDDIYEMLKQHDIFTRKYFYPLTSEFQCYSDKYDAKDTPGVELSASEVSSFNVSFSRRAAAYPHA